MVLGTSNENPQVVLVFLVFLEFLDVLDDEEEQQSQQHNRLRIVSFTHLSDKKTDRQIHREGQTNEQLDK